MSEMFNLLVNCLKCIDNEALPRPSGLPTGLRWYAGHVDPGLDVNATERSENLWSERIRDLLLPQNIHADYQCNYPGSRQTCDLVIPHPARTRFWLEVKRSYRECVYPGSIRSNSAYGKYLAQTADDLDKLARLAAPNATHAGLLLVGFDRPSRPISDEDLTVINDRAAQYGFECESAQWVDQWYTGFRVRVWLWSREVGASTIRSASQSTTTHTTQVTISTQKGSTIFTKQQVDQAFDFTFPTKTDYYKKNFLPFLRELGISSEFDLAPIQSAIRKRLGSRNDADFLYGGRGESSFPEFTQRRRQACVDIVEVLIAHFPQVPQVAR